MNAASSFFHHQLLLLEVLFIAKFNLSPHQDHHHIHSSLLWDEIDLVFTVHRLFFSMGEYSMMTYWEDQTKGEVGDSNLPPKRERVKISSSDETETSSKINDPRVSSLASSPWFRLKDPRIVRVSRGFGGKDRHSKVSTIRGLRDRRVRLSVPTAIQLYELQDRLGLNQPSKVVDWLLDAAKDEIDELPPLPVIDLVNLGQAQVMEQTSRFEIEEQEHVPIDSDLMMYQRPVSHDGLLFPHQMDSQNQVVEHPQGFQTHPNNGTYLPLPYLRTSLVENIMDPSHISDDHQFLQMGSGSDSQNCFFNSLTLPLYSDCHHHHPSERIPFDFDVNARATAPSDKNED